MRHRSELDLPPRVRLAEACLATTGQAEDSFGGQLGKIVENTINSCYRQSLLSRLEVSTLADLKQDLGRNRSNYNRSPRPLSDLEMSLFFPVAAGRLLEPREFIPRIGAVVAQAALASVTETARLLFPTEFTSESCTEQELLIAMFFLECDRLTELVQVLKSDHTDELRDIHADVLAASGQSLAKRIGSARLTPSKCAIVTSRWLLPVAVWYWAMPPAFQEAIRGYLSGGA